MNKVCEPVRKDERGRPIADDGYPLAGLASVREVANASALSVGAIYLMINSGELESRRFGRSVRVPWQAVRETFFGGPMQ